MITLTNHSCLNRYLIKRRRGGKSVEYIEQYGQAVQVSEPFNNKKGPAVNVVEYRQ